MQWLGLCKLPTAVYNGTPLCTLLNCIRRYNEPTQSPKKLIICMCSTEMQPLSTLWTCTLSTILAERAPLVLNLDFLYRTVRQYCVYRDGPGGCVLMEIPTITFSLRCTRLLASLMCKYGQKVTLVKKWVYYVPGKVPFSSFSSLFCFNSQH